VQVEPLREQHAAAGNGASREAYPTAGRLVVVESAQVQDGLARVVDLAPAPQGVTHECRADHRVVLQEEDQRRFEGAHGVEGGLVAEPAARLAEPRVGCVEPEAALEVTRQELEHRRVVMRRRRILQHEHERTFVKAGLAQRGVQRDEQCAARLDARVGGDDDGELRTRRIIAPRTRAPRQHVDRCAPRDEPHRRARRRAHR
jgi:hypothetical protein